MDECEVKVSIIDEVRENRMSIYVQLIRYIRKIVNSETRH